jgi:hypothetical protein
VSINQSLFLPVQTPVLADRLVISVYDYNTVTANILIGSLILSAKQLIKDGSKPGGFYIWRSLYGSPPDNFNEAADAMDENPEGASDWKGMLLLHIQAEVNDKPKKGVETMDPAIKQMAI